MNSQKQNPRMLGTAALGPKGPLVIFFMGVFAMGALSLLVGLLVKENPQAQAAVLYHSELRDRYQLHDLKIARTPQKVTLKFYKKGFLQNHPTEATPGNESANLVTDLARSYRLELNPVKIPNILEVIHLQPGAACTGEQEVSRHSYEFKSRFLALEKNLSKTWGGAVSLSIIENRQLQIDCRQRITKKQLEQCLPIIRNFWEGGWEKIRIRAGGRIFHFRGQLAEKGKQKEISVDKFGEHSRKNPAH